MDTSKAATPDAVTSATPAEQEVVDPRAAWVDARVKRGIWYVIGAVLASAVGIWFLRQANDLVRYVLLSQLLAFALEPAVDRLHTRRHWRRGTATGVLVAGVLLLFVLLGLMTVRVLTDQLDGAVDAVPEWLDRVNGFTEDNFDTTLIGNTDAELSARTTERVATYLRDHAADVLSGLGSTVGVVFSIFTVGLFTFYLTADGPKVRQVLLSRLAPHRQHKVLWAWHTAIDKTGGYLYSRALLALINGAFMFVTLVLVGTPYPLLLAVFSGIVAAFIPIVGTYIAGAVPVAVTLVAAGLVPAGIVLAEIVIYQLLENYVLSPRLSKKTMDLHPGVAYGAALAGGAAGGFIGAFIALPLTAGVQSFLSTYLQRYDVVTDEDPDPTGTVAAVEPGSAPPA
jgi:predicted PurR-regulated permease PerM